MQEDLRGTPGPVSAHAVAAALRDRLPGVGVKKLHKLLYYCQGHHLATFGVPLFAETISAWDMGPVVGQLWHQEKSGEASADRSNLDQAHLNTVGYVVSRYGALTGRDLENLSHAEAPWRQANADRPPGGRVRIEPEWIKEYFATDDAHAAQQVPASVTAWLRDAVSRRTEPTGIDEVTELAARLRHGA